MSFTELDSNSQLQILLDSSNYNKVKIDPANTTRIEMWNDMENMEEK